MPALASCGDGSPSTLEPEGPGARHIADLWWLLFGLGLAVFLTVTAVIVASWVVRREDLQVNQFVLIGGVGLPMVVLAVVGVETVRTTDEVFEKQDEAPPDLVVVGERWWWRVSYPEAGVETANEVHIPAGESVSVELRSADVAHSFWLPELAGKIDMIPGQRNRLVLEADRPGTYRGACAEYCGLQHANMRFLVVAHEPASYLRWLEARQEAPASPDDGAAAEGERLFETEACAGCHTVEGTSAQGTVGPDLTDMGARQELGAGVVENTPDNLDQWIRDARQLKPAVVMPPIDLTDDEAEAIVTYLESLDPG